MTLDASQARRITNPAQLESIDKQITKALKLINYRIKQLSTSWEKMSTGAKNALIYRFDSKGQHSGDYKKIRQNLLSLANKMKTYLTNAQTTIRNNPSKSPFFIDRNPANSSLYGYTNNEFIGQGNIALAGSYINNRNGDDYGYDSRSGTLIHEVSHIYGTGDFKLYKDEGTVEYNNTNGGIAGTGHAETVERYFEDASFSQDFKQTNSLRR